MLIENNIESYKNNIFDFEYYKKNPFFYDEKINSKYLLNDIDIINILKFKDVNPDIKFLFNSIHENPEDYNISIENYNILKKKYNNEVNNNDQIDLLYNEINNNDQIDLLNNYVLLDNNKLINEIENIDDNNLIKNDKINLLENDQINLLENDQINLLENNQINLLENNQINLLENNQINLLENDDFFNEYNYSHIKKTNDSSLNHQIYSDVHTITTEKKKLEIKKNKKLFLKEIKNLINKKHNFITQTKKYSEILLFLNNISTNKIEQDDLELDNDEIDELYLLIIDIKKETKIDMSFIVIKIILFIVEIISVKIFNKEIFKDISKNITPDIIKSELYQTHTFIKKSIACPEFPFLDLLIYLIKSCLPIF